MSLPFCQLASASSVTEEHGAVRHICVGGPLICHTSLVTKRTVRVSRRDLPRGVGRGACPPPSKIFEI